MPNPRRYLILLFSLVVMAAPWSNSYGLDVPPLVSHVNDYAHMLDSATRQQLESILTSLEQQESTQIAVLTVDSLEGEDLEQFSLRVVEAWQLGQKKLDNGALLLIARNDRKIRIEVGYGLEGRLTDLTSSRIIRDIIAPQFKSGNFAQGISGGVNAMISAVRGEFSEQTAGSSHRPSQDNHAGFLVFVLFGLFQIARIFRSRVLATTVGAIGAPFLGSLFFGFSWMLLLAMIPLGALAGFLASLLFGASGLTSSRYYRNHSSFPGSFGGGGFGGGGGGFSGGGGGFGGGGSSGGW